MHLLARYPGYIMDGDSFRHIPWFVDYVGGGGGAGGMQRGRGSNMLEILKKCKKYRKIKGC